MRSLVRSDGYSCYDSIQIPDLQDDSGYENPHGHVPEKVQVIPEDATLYGEVNLKTVPYMSLDRLVKRSEQAAESSTFDDGMTYNDALLRLTGISADLIRAGTMETLTNGNFYWIGNSVVTPTDDKYDAVLGRNRQRMLARLSKIISDSIGTGNVWQRLFEDHVERTNRLRGTKHKTSGESMHWFVEKLVPKLCRATSRKSFASSLYTPGSIKYSETEMKHDRYHPLAPPHLLASLDVILTVSAVPEGVNALAAFLPTRHCTDELLCELVIVAKKITDSYKEAYDGGTIPQKVPGTKDYLKAANAKLKFIWRASFYQSVLFAFSKSLELGGRKDLPLDPEFLRLSAYARAVHLAMTGEVPTGSAEHEQKMLKTSEGQELEAPVAIFGLIPKEDKERIEKAAEANDREPSVEELTYWKPSTGAGQRKRPRTSQKKSDGKKPAAKKKRKKQNDTSEG